MKRFGIVSIALAALLFVGCGEKKEQHAAKSEASAVTKEMKQEAPKPAAKPAQSETHKGDQAPAQSEPLPGVPAQAPEAKQSSSTQTAVQKAQATVSSMAQTVKEAAKEGMKEAEEKLHQAAAAATGGAAGATAAVPKEEKTEATTKAAADGAKLFAKCASCHGPKGDRKALGKSGIIAGMAKDEVLKKLKGYQAGTLNQYGMGALMKGQLAGLKEADLEALADYISKLK